jgi:dipeptidase D
MFMNIRDLEPKEVWKFFYEVTQIPRPSKKEGRMVRYLLDFAQDRNLEVKKDSANNVLIKKNATPGKEHLPTIILQAHIDMVCEKNKETVFDFDNDSIQTYIDGDWVKARGTTLGADDGIGVAAQLAILDSKTIAHGKLECFFTTDEEVGLNGAYALQSGFLSGGYLINLDSEKEGEFYVGCAGGKTTQATFTYKAEKAPDGYFWFNVQVKGLNGGHSGGEIHRGLGNANKILTRYLWGLAQKTSLYIAQIDGGNLGNAIPREASALAGIPFDHKEDAITGLNILQSLVEAELKAIDPSVNLSLESTDAPQTCIDPATANTLLNTLYACPHGVIGMSFYMPGLVETSTNLASIKMKENNTILVTTSQRSGTNSLRFDVSNMVKALFTLSGAEVTSSEGYPNWKPNPNSKILKASETIYENLFGQKPEIKAIHAGLECGLFLEKYPALDMISCGPTILGAHSPDEKLQISTVEKWWKFLIQLLEKGI